MLLDKHLSELAQDPGRPAAYEVIEPGKKAPSSGQYHRDSFDALAQCDRQIYDLIEHEYDRQQTTLALIAAESQCSQAVLAALGSVVQNKTTEGFVGGRYHGGCQVVDQIEQIAVDRAKAAFAARYANVQPHCGTSANQIVMAAVLAPHDRILSLGLDQGGHVSHGADRSIGGTFYQTQHYYVDRGSFLLDYDSIRERARTFRPKLIICGASAYSRQIDFARFREIADEVGAYLLADVSHICSLVVAGVHPSPIDHAHFTTTSTYKPGGPRGGLILMGRDFDQRIEVGGKSIPLWLHVQKTTFPGVQGTPYLNNIAAKAVFFQEMLSAEYKKRQARIIENARALARALLDRGYDVLTGGTDNHMVMVNVSNSIPGLTGVIAQSALEQCGIVINMNRLPYDTRSARITSGMRLGTPIVTRNGMGPEQMEQIAALIDVVLRHVEAMSDREYRLTSSLKDQTRAGVELLCRQFPMR